MKLYFTLLLSLLQFSVSSPSENTDELGLAARSPEWVPPNPKRYRLLWTYKHQAYRDLGTIPDKGPITSQQTSVLQKDFSNILSGIKGGVNANEHSPKLTAQYSNKLLDILEQIEHISLELLDEIAAHKDAFTSAGLLGFVCSDLEKACGGLQQFYSSYQNISTPAPGKKAEALEKDIEEKCEGTLAALGC